MDDLRGSEGAGATTPAAAGRGTGLRYSVRHEGLDAIVGALCRDEGGGGFEPRTRAGRRRGAADDRAAGDRSFRRSTGHDAGPNFEGGFAGEAGDEARGSDARNDMRRCTSTGSFRGRSWYKQRKQQQQQQQQQRRRRVSWSTLRSTAYIDPGKSPEETARLQVELELFPSLPFASFPQNQQQLRQQQQQQRQRQQIITNYPQQQLQQQQRTVRVTSLPWTDHRGVQGTYTGDVNRRIRPHGRGSFEAIRDGRAAFYEGEWEDGQIASVDNEGLSEGDMPGGAQCRPLRKRDSTGSARTVAAPEILEGDRGQPPLQFGVRAAGAIPSLSRARGEEKKDESSADDDFPDPGPESHVASTTSLPGYQLGTALRHPSHMHSPPGKAAAIERARSLKPLDFAFVLRSSGEWTYGIVADLPRGIEGPSIRFVLDGKGSTKTIREKYWRRGVRSVNRRAFEAGRDEGGDVGGGMEHVASDAAVAADANEAGKWDDRSELRTNPLKESHASIASDKAVVQPNTSVGEGSGVCDPSLTSPIDGKIRKGHTPRRTGDRDKTGNAVGEEASEKLGAAMPSPALSSKGDVLRSLLSLDPESAQSGGAHHDQPTSNTPLREPLATLGKGPSSSARSYQPKRKSLSKKASLGDDSVSGFNMSCSTFRPSSRRSSISGDKPSRTWSSSSFLATTMTIDTFSKKAVDDSGNDGNGSPGLPGGDEAHAKGKGRLRKSSSFDSLGLVCKNSTGSGPRRRGGSRSSPDATLPMRGRGSASSMASASSFGALLHEMYCAPEVFSAREGMREAAASKRRTSERSSEGSLPAISGVSG